MQRLIEGQVLTRRDIAVLFGGNARAFLPRVTGGEVVAGCFDPAMNPRVPSEVLVHNAPNAILAARRLVQQCRPKKVQSPKSRVQGSMSQVQSSKFQVESPGSEVYSQGPNTLHSALHTPHSALENSALKDSASPSGSIPVFIKLEPNVWEYIGRFRAIRYVTDPAQVAARIYEIRPRVYEKYARTYGEMKGILHLEQTP